MGFFFLSPVLLTESSTAALSADDLPALPELLFVMNLLPHLATWWLANTRALKMGHGVRVHA